MYTADESALWCIYTIKKFTKMKRCGSMSVWFYLVPDDFTNLCRPLNKACASVA